MTWPLSGEAVPRLHIEATMAGTKLAAGDTLRIVVPDSFTVTSPGASINRNDGNGVVSLFTGLGPYTLQSADVPAIGGMYPIVPTGTLALAIGPTFSISNPPVVPDAPTIGTLSQVGATAASQAGTAPGNNGGAAITEYAADVYDGDTSAFISTFTNATLPVPITGITQGRRIFSRLRAINSVGTSPHSSASSTITVGVVNLAQGASPYTVLASDSGKRIVPAATTAEFFIDVPTGLGAAFVCDFAPTGSYPVTIRESGTQVSNSGYRISNANNLANSILLPGKTGTMTASSANVLTLTGQFMRWQQVIDGTGLNDSNTGGYAVVSSFSKHRAIGQDGEFIVGVKFLYAHRYGNVETVPAYSADVGFSVEYPLGSTPQLCKFAGVDQVTVTGNETIGGVVSDYLLLATPIPLSAAGTEVGIHSGQRTGAGATPCLTGKGSGRLLTGEVFQGGGSDGTGWKTNLSVIGSTLADQAQSRTSLSSPGIFRPSAIIGVTNTGATMILVDSRSQPSNGDRQTVSSGYRGQGERLIGGLRPTLNAAISASQMTFFNSSTQGKWRQYLATFCTDWFLGGFYNDANKSLPAIRALIPTAKALPSMANKLMTLRSTDPGTTSTDKWSSRAGQAAINLTNSQNIDTINAEGAAKTLAGVDKFIDARPFVEDPTPLADGTRGYRTSGGARTVTDGVMANGSDLLTSATANFSAADTGHYVFVSGLTVSGQSSSFLMTYDSAAGGVRLKSIESEQQVVAQADLTGQTCNIQCQESTYDGIHTTIIQGLYEQSNRSAMQPF